MLKRWLVLCWLALSLGLGLVQAQEGAPSGVAYVIDAGGAVRLRSAPSLLSDILANLAPYTPVQVLGQSSDGLWLQLQTAEGQSGWMSIDFVNLNGAGVGDGSVLVDPREIVPLRVMDYVHNIQDEARTLFAQGQGLGRRANVFSKIGDSITASPYNLIPIGQRSYQLGAYSYLQPTIDFFSATLARDKNSFANTSLAATPGWTAYSAINPELAPGAPCAPGELAIDCELRLSNPAFAFIMYGTNDVAWVSAGEFRDNMRILIRRCKELGIVPILSTLPPRIDYDFIPAKVTEFNVELNRLAGEEGIPIVDYYGLMVNLPNYGLDVDGVHPATPAYKLAADFRVENLWSGAVVRNLLQLHMLDALYRRVVQGLP